MKKNFLVILTIFIFSCGASSDDKKHNTKETVDTVLFVEVAGNQGFTAVADSSKSANTKTSDIEYIKEKDGRMYTKLTGRYKDSLVVLLDVEEGDVCYEALEQKDYNGDGYDELCVELINGCGGNCCGNSLQIFYFDGEKFGATESYGWDWDGIKIKTENGKTYFMVQTINAGYNNSEVCGDKVETFVFEDFKLKLVDLKTEKEVEAVLDFTFENYGKGFVEYDIDNDGKLDKITGGYFERWGCLSDVKIIFANGKTFAFNSSADRVGVLDTKTKNYQDLVLDCEDIYVWDGNGYVPKQ